MYTIAANYTGQRVLVTGATGFFGGALAMQLANLGAEVVALTRDPSHGQFLAALPNIHLVQGDLCNPASIEAAVAGCRYIFHAAVNYEHSYTVQRRVNVEGTRTLIQAAAIAGVARFIHISTVAVYGYSQRINREDERNTPSAEPYGVSKNEGEQAVRSATSLGKLDYSIIRPGCIYGPRSRAWTASLFRYARRKPLLFVGPGDGCLPMIFVDDLVELCLLAGFHPKAAGETFNAVSVPAPTIREVLQAYARLARNHTWYQLPLGITSFLIKPATDLLPQGNRLRLIPEMIAYGNNYTHYDMSKSARLLNWQPKTPVHIGIERCIPWLIEQGLL